MAMFGFGDFHTVTIGAGRRKGQQNEVPQYSFHLQCGWRLRRAGEILVGWGDLFFTIDGHEPSESRPSRFQSRLKELMSGGLKGLRVERVVADDVGSVQIALERGHLFEILPMDSGRPDESFEH